MTSVVLLALTAALLLAAPRLLHRGDRVVRSPRAEMLAWSGAVTATALAAGGAGLTAASPLVRDVGGAGELIHRCPQFVAAVAAHPYLLAAAILGIGSVLILVARALIAAVRLARRRRADLARHRLMLTACGQAGQQLAVVPSPRPAVWCVPSGGGCVVVTEAARSALSPQELAAVVAHERAHLRGRHHLIVATLTAFAAALPCRLTRDADNAVAELLEMRADEVAARERGAGTVARALLLLSGVKPDAALGAGGGAAARRRVERLLDTPRPAPLAMPVTAIAITTLTVLPLLLTAYAVQSVFGLHYCPLPT